MDHAVNHFRVYPDLEQLSRAAADEFVRAAGDAIAKRGRFSVALSGGRTPRRLYELLGGEYRGDISWPHIYLCWADERYVPHDDFQSNLRLVREALLAHISIPASQIFPMPTHSAGPGRAAKTYELNLRRAFNSVWPEFDLGLLGMGADGHTASLFPGSPALLEKEGLCIAVRAPVEPALRLTLTLPVLNRARDIFFLVSGTDKQETLKFIRDHPAEAEMNLPAAMVRGRNRTLWFVDRAAFGGES